MCIKRFIQDALIPPLSGPYPLIHRHPYVFLAITPHNVVRFAEFLFGQQRQFRFGGELGFDRWAYHRHRLHCCLWLISLMFYASLRA